MPKIVDGKLVPDDASTVLAAVSPFKVVDSTAAKEEKKVIEEIKDDKEKKHIHDREAIIAKITSHVSQILADEQINGRVRGRVESRIREVLWDLKV